MTRILQILIFLTIASGMVSCIGRAAKKQSEAPVIPVTVTNVRLAEAIFYNSYPANVVALKEVELRGQVSGYITGIFFTEGRSVRAGEKLYEIDRRKYQATYEGIRSGVKIAEANLEKVRRDADRYSDLALKDAIAKQMLDNAMTDLLNARQQLDAANSELIKAKADYDYSLITAPFDGTIGFSRVKLGALVTPGQTLLNTISSDDPMGIDFEINETELRRFRELEGEAVSKNDTTFRILLADNSMFQYPASISVIDRAVNPQTGTIRVRVTVPNREKMLKSGMSCKVLVLNAEAGQKLLIPYKAVMEQLSEYFVFKVDDKKVRQVKVTLGPIVKSDVIVLQGLAKDDTIVVDGLQKLHEGSEVLIETR